MHRVKNITVKKYRNRAPIKVSIDKLKEDVSQYSAAYQYERAERLGVSKHYTKNIQEIKYYI
ncbi:hypothetical protein [Orientia tsutsugamushi]|uniref:Transposase n=1 Tax=Orientia tsutsugamushi TaxID=784 RepID=A0A2U3RSV4_ORITS|nr:hypothetical protein [Orientia tsutsugamushi]KJV53190.1 transposase family protein [Orientia tsutsugamushi str. Karp]KJV73561.1 transposase family protein [Orientia tsutsugamushi str. TA763]SPP23686.1 transposase [Orientia tsutsugamushi]SPR16300.1 transposase [Orientia tsutsugamushi]